MVQKINAPTQITAPGNKIIEEYVGRVHTKTNSVSVAHMIAPPGWTEPFQQPDFDEVTLVIRGTLLVDHADGPTEVRAGEVIYCGPGERIRYSNPFDQEAEYWAICVPAFKDTMAHREEE
jgi:mannose-6-phosphate isomerase-like protein (cupin superfamily)